MFGVIQPRGRKVTWHEGVPDLEELQKLVGGYVEAVDLAAPTPTRRITVWLNEEGRLHGLPPSVYLPNLADALPAPEAEILGTVLGPVVITAVDGPEGDAAPLTEAERAAVLLGRSHTVSFQFGAMIPHLEWDGPSRDPGDVPAGPSPGYPGEPPAGMDYGAWLAMNNVD